MCQDRSYGLDEDDVDLRSNKTVVEVDDEKELIVHIILILKKLINSQKYCPY